MIDNDVHRLVWKQGYSSVSLRFQASTDGVLTQAINSNGESQLELRIAHGSLLVESGSFSLDIEDSYGIACGTEHALVLSFGSFGTRIYIDGYQVFSCATNLQPQEDTVLQNAQSNTLHVYDVDIELNTLKSEEICNRYECPAADIEFAAAYLAEPDINRISTMHTGTLYARFRVRGINQYGTIIAASRDNQELLNLSIDDDGFLYKVYINGGWNEYRAPGYWNDGQFHDVVVRAFRGAIDIYVNGSLIIHEPGQYMCEAVGGIDYFSIGEDTHGVRLFGEVRSGGIYTYALTDGQIASLSHKEPVTTTALFDKGFEGSASYRIPSMVTTPSGVVIAGCDQRVVISNDAPNKIHFVIRRSLDGGHTWNDLQTVISYPDKDEPSVDGASLIDSCMLVDRNTGRVIVLVDHFPGGVGFANAIQRRGTDDQGRLILTDDQDNSYYLNSDGTVEADTNNDSEATPASAYTVDEDGYVTYNGRDGGNIFFKKGIDENETLLTVRTSYLVEVHSDDDGATWSKPRYIDWMLREEWMGFLGTSPGSGLQLSTGPYAGRLLVPYYCCSANPQYSAGGALISDDGGNTWYRGHCINENRVVNGVSVDVTQIGDNDATTHESVFIEDSNGDVVVFFRNQHHSGRVGKAISHDGGNTWDELEFDPNIPDIFSQPNAITLPDREDWTYGEASHRVLFANACLMRPYRGCGVLRYSEDGGRTWKHSRCFNPYHYVYQCMSVRPDGDVGLLWERETAGVYYTHLTRSWLGID